MPANHDIVILSGYTPSPREPRKSLHIHPSRTVNVEPGDTVTWSITGGKTNVYSFRIQKKSTSGEIFSSAAPPPSRQTNRGRGRVSGSAPRGRIYDYSIWWKRDQNSPEIEHDPKIAINTSLHDKSNLLITAAVALTAIGLTALIYFSIQKRKRKLANNPIDANAEVDFTEPGIHGNE